MSTKFSNKPMGRGVQISIEKRGRAKRLANIHASMRQGNEIARKKREAKLPASQIKQQEARKQPCKWITYEDVRSKDYGKDEDE